MCLLIILDSAWVLAEQPAPSRIDFEPLDCRWTFGNHEPIAMYRRAGNRVTGGIEGGALWLEDWHHWFDSEASTRLMEELGLNMLHCRFYKGMGWQFESRDFPNVKRFVANCHKHGVRVLAYVQFSTLYYETMLVEIPDLADWVAQDENGRKRTWHAGAYYRWLPCVNAPGFEPYLKKLIGIALGEGGFDGIMFDNCHAPPCHCPRCAALFREHLAGLPKPEERFGIPTVEHVLPPPDAKYGEVQDPIRQEWIRFHCRRVTDLYRRLYLHAKKCKPAAIVSGNIQNVRRANMAAAAGLSVTDLPDCFDIFVSQSGNAPGLSGGYIINRVREMKLSRALGTHVLALCDSDAGTSPEAQSAYLLALVEDAVFGGIPTDRTVMAPAREMVSERVVKFRKPLLRRFNEAVHLGRAGLERPSYQPVLLLYSRESEMFSEQSHRAILAAEEILLRNHVPYGLLVTDADTPLEIPAGCELLLVCDQRCLGDDQLDALARFAKKGGQLLITGRSGEHDESYRQRQVNPLERLDGRANVVRRTEVDRVLVKGAGWTIKVAAPPDGGRRLTGDMTSLRSPKITIEAPATTLAEVKRDARATTVHLLNYARQPVSKGARVKFRADAPATPRCTLASPLEGRPAAAVDVKKDTEGWYVVDVPPFCVYAAVKIAGATDK